DVPVGGFIWRGVLQRLELQPRQAGRWGMGDTSDSLVVAADRVVLRRELCLTSGESSLCLSGAWRRAAPWSARASIRHLPLALTQPFLPGGWSLGGELQGTIQAGAGEEGRLAVQARLQPGPGQIGYPAGAVSHEIHYRRGTLDLVSGPAGLKASLAFALLNADGDSTGRVQARLEIPEFQGLGLPSDSQRLAGSAGLRLSDLEALEALAPELQGLRGSLALQLELEGTVGSPEVLGEARLTNGAVDVPMLGLELRELDLSATGEPDGRIALEGGFRSGENRLKISGDSRLSPSPDAPSHLRLEGERVVAMNTERGRVEASPKIDLEFDGDLLRIEGELTVDTADIQLGEADRVVKVSPDVVYADSAAAQPEMAIDARVRVSLDGPVRVEGFGFAGQLSGSVLVAERPDEPTSGSGELVVDTGKYSAFGQTLTIEKGRLIFAGGPIDNPGLDIVATRSTEDVKAGMQVTGTAQTPLVTLFSEPPLPQDRIAVILATGGALESKGESDGNILESAQSKLGIKGANVLVRRIAAELDLEEARIESGGSLQEASLLAGKYLSPRLYVKYGLSLVDPLRLLQLRYMLSSKWTLVAETGEERGIDLLYRIETGI
ncbi:MAG: translocation/assembly module TamB domain-containing protein, partial [Gemmatimonadales bacterium]